MKNFRFSDYKIRIICEGKNADVDVSIDEENAVYLTADKSKPKFVELKWNFESDGDLLVLGDAWERSYGDLEFRKLRENDRYMPWYFMATYGKTHYCFGVKTQPNAYVSFSYDMSGVTAIVDCRNGSKGVRLGGRTVKLCTFVFEEYGDSAFEALCDFCKMLCDSPLLPTDSVYGFNNWYYAYGESSYEQIVSDTKLLMSVAKGLDEKPFSVIDDGWQINSCKGPWLANGKFRDMKALADEIKSLGARPGIWVRFLENDMGKKRTLHKKYLDPTLPETRELICEDIKRIKGWDYELIKHDFSTADLFGNFGADLDKTITKKRNWHFYDRTKTNAEITLDFYRLIKEQCGDMLILGCNTVSHLSAGLVHISRTGDDTSGREWARTLKMGVNSLAFRLAQNGAFYIVDADCVGILDDNIEWQKNGQWLDLLSKSNTALFVSAKELTDEQSRDIKSAFSEAQNNHSMQPLDWFETKTPKHGQIDGKETRYEW